VKFLVSVGGKLHISAQVTRLLHARISAKTTKCAHAARHFTLIKNFLSRPKNFLSRPVFHTCTRACLRVSARLSSTRYSCLFGNSVADKQRAVCNSVADRPLSLTGRFCSRNSCFGENSSLVARYPSSVARYASSVAIPLLSHHTHPFSQDTQLF